MASICHSTNTSVLVSLQYLTHFQRHVVQAAGGTDQVLTEGGAIWLRYWVSLKYRDSA